MTAEAFKRQLEALAADYRRDLPEKLAQIDSIWRDLMHGAAQPDRITELQRELHSLAGSAGTFGVAGVSEAAAKAESFLDPYCARRKIPGLAEQAKFTTLLDALRRTAS